MYFAIDDIELIRKPFQIEIVPKDHRNLANADESSIIQPPSEEVQVLCTFGRNLSYEKVIAELRRRRADRGIHSITFEDSRTQKYLTINAYMGTSRIAHVGYAMDCKIVTSAFTIPFIQERTSRWLWPCRFRLRSILAVLSPFRFQIAPAAGEFFAIDGWIADLGAGAGQTRIQIHNVERAVDYLSTPGDFLNVAPPVKSLQNAVLDTDQGFEGGQQLNCNVTQIPAGGMSADAIVTYWAWINHPG